MAKNEKQSSTIPLKVKSDVGARREFLKVAGLAAGAAVIMPSLSSCEPKPPAQKKSDQPRLAMLIDLRRCIGCDSCSVACKSENGVRLGGFRAWVNKHEKGTYPKVGRVFIPRLCNHCENPPCLSACPVKAIEKRGDGVVVVNKNKCVGAQACIEACPYGAPYFNSMDDKTKEVSRIANKVDKCDFCVHRIDNGLVPSCVNGCPQNARIFGDINDPNSEISRLMSANKVATLLSAKGTKPHVFYIDLDESVVIANRTKAKGNLKGGK